MGLEFRVKSLRFRVSGLVGFRVSGGAQLTCGPTTRAVTLSERRSSKLQCHLECTPASLKLGYLRS